MILDLIREHGRLSMNDLIDLSGLPERVVSGTIGSLLRKNEITRSNNGPDVFYEPALEPDEDLPVKQEAPGVDHGQKPEPQYFTAEAAAETIKAAETGGVTEHKATVTKPKEPKAAKRAETASKQPKAPACPEAPDVPVVGWLGNGDLCVIYPDTGFAELLSPDKAEQITELSDAILRCRALVNRSVATSI